MDGVVQQPTLFIQQTEVHPPGVDADSIEAALVNRFGYPLLDFEKQPQDIRIVGKPVDFLHPDFPVLIVGQDRPAAGRAEVKSQYALACQCLSPPAYLLERTSASYFLTISSHSSSVPALFRLQ